MIYNVRCSCGAPCDFFGNAGEPIGTPPTFMCVHRRQTGQHRSKKRSQVLKDLNKAGRHYGNVAMTERLLKGQA